MTIANEMTVGQLVVEQPGRARVFERLGIDYCCGGKKPFSQACQEKGLDPSVVMRELSSAVSSAKEPDWSRATLTELADHIEATHHRYLKQELPRLEFLLNKIADRHGPNRPALIELRDVFIAFEAELESHMRKEEEILFPMCRQMEASTAPMQFHCGSVSNPIRVMVQEHDDAGQALERMRQLTEDYLLPDDACNTYRAAFASLVELEADMHQHVHKENNILFPKAIELEAKRRG